MAAAGPAPRGCSRAGARPFQYGAAANNTSASTQRKQHWRRTALAAAALRLAARAADAHRGPRSAARPHGKRSLCWANCGRLRVLPCLVVPAGSRFGALPAILGAFPRSWERSRLTGAAALLSRSSFGPSGVSPARPQRLKSGERQGKTCSS